MKRYWLFMYKEFDADGGMNDFVDSADDVEELEEGVMWDDGWCHHIVDSLEGTVV